MSFCGEHLFADDLFCVQRIIVVDKKKKRCFSGLHWMCAWLGRVGSGLCEGANWDGSVGQLFAAGGVCLRECV